MCPKKYSAERSSADPWSCLCSFLPSGAPPSPVTLASPDSQLSPQLMSSLGPPWLPTSLLWPKNSPGCMLGNSRAQLFCFPALRDPFLHGIQCFQSCCFIYSIWFSNCFRWKGKFSFYYSIREAYFPVRLLKHTSYSVSPLLQISM